MSGDERLSKTQDSAGRNVLPTVTVFQRLGVNDVGTFSQNRTDTVTDSSNSELKLK